MSLRSRAAAATSYASTLGRGAVEALRDEVGGRRVWARGGRAYVEARGLHDADVSPAYVDALERTLSSAAGVRWAAVNGVLGDVVINFDAERIGVERLRQLVAQVERAHGMADRHRDRPIHPSDFEQVFDRLVELAGDLLGAAIGLGARAAPGLSLPPEALAVPALADLLPDELRRRLDRRFGAIRVEMVLSLLGSVLGASARAPLSSLADAALRAVEIPEALASRHAWERRSADLAADQSRARADPLPSPGPRPMPLPDGATERYGRRAKAVTALAAVPTLVTGGARRAGRTVLVGTPKAATMGADAFAAELGRLLASRGVVVRDPGALRRLDRVDTVVIDVTALSVGASNVADVATRTEGAVAERARQRVRRMFDPQRPTAVVRDGHWRLGPLDEFDVSVPEALLPALRRARTRHDEILALVRDRGVAAVVALAGEVDPLIEGVAAAAHQLGQVVVAPSRRGLAEQAGADGSVPGRSRLAASVRALQRDGHVVAVIAGGNEAALVAADVGIGVMPAQGPPPWAAHLLCGPGLSDAWLILRAARMARSSGDRSAHLALLGAITSAVIALASPSQSAGRRSGVPVNLAALAAIVASVWSVNRLAHTPLPAPTPEIPVALDVR